MQSPNFRGSLETPPDTFSASNQLQQPKKEGMSTGAKIAIGAGVLTALAVGGDFLFCKGKHVKSIFKFGNKGNKPNNTKPNKNSTKKTITSTPTNNSVVETSKVQSSTNNVIPTNAESSAVTSNTKKAKFGKKTDTRDVHCYKLYNRTASDLEAECTHFKNITGAQLHVPDTMSAENFGMACSTLEVIAKDGNFPKDIKHVLVGHGYGSSVRGDWGIVGKGGNVFNYINNNIKKGEKVLVLCCESYGEVPGKDGIGKEVILSLTDGSHPAKIVIAGENKVAGQFYLPRWLSEWNSTPNIYMYKENIPKFRICNKK